MFRLDPSGSYQNMSIPLQVESLVTEKILSHRTQLYDQLCLLIEQNAQTEHSREWIQSQSCYGIHMVIDSG